MYAKFCLRTATATGQSEKLFVAKLNKKCSEASDIVWNDATDVSLASATYINSKIAVVPVLTLKAHGAQRDAAGVLYFQNVIQFQATRVCVTVLRPYKLRSSLSRFSRKSQTVKILCTFRVPNIIQT